MSHSEEVLATDPLAFWPLVEDARAATPEGYTLQAGHPITEHGDVAAVVLDADKQPASAYVNGEPVALDHPYVPKLIAAFSLRG